MCRLSPVTRSCLNSTVELSYSQRLAYETDGLSLPGTWSIETPLDLTVAEGEFRETPTIAQNHHTAIFGGRHAWENGLRESDIGTEMNWRGEPDRGRVGM